MKKIIAIIATVVGIHHNTSAGTPDTLNYKLDLDIKKYGLVVNDKSPCYAYKIMNGEQVQGHMFQYKDSTYCINVYHYYDIGVTRIDGVVKSDSILVRTNKRLTINGAKTKFGMHYTFCTPEGKVEAMYTGKRK